MAERKIMTGEFVGGKPIHTPVLPGDTIVTPGGETVATVGEDGKIRPTDLPSEAVDDMYDVGSEEAMLALDVEVGDACRRTDLQKTFVLAAMPPTSAQNWKEVLAHYDHSHDELYEPKDPAIQQHIGSPHAPADAQKNSDILKEEIEAKLVGKVSTHSHSPQTVGAIPAIEKNAPDGVCPLDSNRKIPADNIPGIAITDTFVVDSEALMLAIGVQTGDVAIRTDLRKVFICWQNDGSKLEDWKELLVPLDVVQSVFGRAGVVSAQAGDYTAAQVSFAPTETLNRLNLQAAVEFLDQTKSNARDLPSVALTGEYADLLNKPNFHEVALSGDYRDLKNLPALKPVATSGSYPDLTERPTLHLVSASGDYRDLENLPALKPVATSGSYPDLTERPVLSAVSASGNYMDLLNKPVLEVKKGEIHVDAGRTDSYIPDGTNDRPFKTVSDALIGALPGNVVFVKAGTYTEALQIPSGVSLRGFGALVSGPVQTANDLVGISIVGMFFSNLLHVRCPALISECRFTRNVVVEDADVTMTSTSILCSAAGTDALSLNGGRFFGSCLDVSATGACSAVVHTAGVATISSSRLRSSGNGVATVGCIGGIGTAVRLELCSIENSSETVCVHIDNGANAALPNLLGNVLVNCAVNCNDSATVVNCVKGAVPSGTALLHNPSSQISNDSGTVPGATVADALNHIYNTYLKVNNVNGSFVTADGKRVTVVNGQINSITTVP